MSIEVTVEYAHREWNSYDHVVHIRNYQQLQAKVAELEAENRIERNLRIGVEATFDMLNEEIGRYKAAFEQQKAEIQRWKYSAENPNFKGRLDTWQSVAGKYRAEAEELTAEVERLSVAHVKACQANADSQAELAAAQEENEQLRSVVFAAESLDKAKLGFQVKQLTDQLATAEQRVAEACTLLCMDAVTKSKSSLFRSGAIIVAGEIRDGEWRKFVKEV